MCEIVFTFDDGNEVVIETSEGVFLTTQKNIFQAIQKDAKWLFDSSAVINMRNVNHIKFYKDGELIKSFWWENM